MRFIRNHCRLEWVGGSHLDSENVVEPGHASSNGSTWVFSRLQMRDLDDGTSEPTGRTERIDQLTDCTVVGDETDPVLTVTGQSTFLAEAGLAEEDRQVTIKVTQNPKFR